MTRFADYDLVDSLGAGNHGEYWLARPPARLGYPSDELTALKILGSHHTENDFRRMANELRVYAAIECDSLVPIIDAGHVAGRLFYASPYFKDGSLAQPARPLDQATVMGAISDAAVACHQLHEAGIAHRDIKPGNILLEQDHGYLGDLGLAQILHPGQTSTGLGPVGTVHFIAPEVVRGANASRASDVWSLGVTLHTVLTGRPVFRDIEGKDLLSALRTILANSPQIHPTLPRRACPVVERCLAQNPSDRYPTALAFAEALRESSPT